MCDKHDMVIFAKSRLRWTLLAFFSPFGRATAVASVEMSVRQDLLTVCDIDHDRLLIHLPTALEFCRSFTALAQQSYCVLCYSRGGPIPDGPIATLFYDILAADEGSDVYPPRFG
jgi:hypothetical protein